MLHGHIYTFFTTLPYDTLSQHSSVLILIQTHAHICGVCKPRLSHTLTVGATLGLGLIITPTVQPRFSSESLLTFRDTHRQKNTHSANTWQHSPL